MKLTLAEGLYLIALDDEEGRLISSAEKSIDRGLVAACLFDLYIQKKIEFGDGTILKFANQGYTSNKLLDDIIKFVAQKPAPLIDLIEWIVANYKDIQLDVNHLLIDRGIIRKEATKLFWIPVSERMENANYAYEKEIRTAMSAIALKGAKAPASLIVLLMLIHYCNLLDEVFGNKDELITAKKFIKGLLDKGWVDDDTTKALELLAPYFEKLK